MFCRITFASQLQILLGTIRKYGRDPDAVNVGVSRIISHPDYDADGHISDIALLQLSSPVTFTDTILPICLPSSTVDLNRFKVCVDTGFGRTGYSGMTTATSSFLCFTAHCSLTDFETVFHYVDQYAVVSGSENNFAKYQLALVCAESFSDVKRDTGCY